MSDSSVRPVIGVIGGVGPYAGLDLVRKIFDQTLARTDQDHLPVALLSLPSAIPDRTEYLLGREKTNPAIGIADVALQLERMGVRVAAIPCNTAHADAIFESVLGELGKQQSRLKMLHMIREVVGFLQMEYPGLRRIGVLSTTGTYRARLYARPLEEIGYQVVAPDPAMQEAIVHPAIYHAQYGIKTRSNPVTGQARRGLEEAIRSLKRDGAEVIILACTELPLAITEPSLYDLPMIDPTAILARALIREVVADKLKPLPEPTGRAVVRTPFPASL
jgi:aspartate racemase